MIRWLKNLWYATTDPGAGGGGLGGFFYRLNGIIVVLLIGWVITFAILYLFFGCHRAEGSPLPSFPKERLIGRWWYASPIYPGIVGIIDIKKSGLLYNGGSKTADGVQWSSPYHGRWEYDGWTLTIWPPGKDWIRLRVGASSERNRLKCLWTDPWVAKGLRVTLYKEGD